jgi:hypothetical protein
MKTSKEKLKRDKLDFTERTLKDTYKTDALLSHKRPVVRSVEVRKPDRTKDRALTQTLDKTP